jgi:hypothetical protein
MAGRENWRKRPKKLLNGGDGVPKVSGLLASFMPAQAPLENLDRTERLLRLLIAADPKVAKLRRLKRGKASTANSPSSRSA